jgi:hypothetical protein
VPQRAYQGFVGSVHGVVGAPQGFLVVVGCAGRAGPKKGYTVFGGAVLGELQSDPPTRVHHGAARSLAFSVERCDPLKVAHGERCGSAAIQDWLWRTRRKEQCRAINGVLILCFALLLSTYTCSAIAFTPSNTTAKNVSIGKTLIRHQDPAWRSVRP